LYSIVFQMAHNCVWASSFLITRDHSIAQTTQWTKTLALPLSVYTCLKYKRLVNLW
jgi:hypothetical protein